MLANSFHEAKITLLSKPDTVNNGRERESKREGRKGRRNGGREGGKVGWKEGGRRKKTIGQYLQCKSSQKY
jgi:hypothetical protein